MLEFNAKAELLLFAGSENKAKKNEFNGYSKQKKTIYKTEAFSTCLIKQVDRLSTTKSPL